MKKKIFTIVLTILLISYYNDIKAQWFPGVFPDLWTTNTCGIGPVAPASLLQNEGIDDTMMGTGHELMDFMTAYYNSAKEAAKRNVPGAGSVADDLGDFFDRPDQPDGPTKPPTPEG